MRKGNVIPNYLSLGSVSISLATEMIRVFEESVGKKRASLSERLEELETSGVMDYKTVRGLAAILDRRCAYVVDNKFEPMSIRTVVFEESSKRRLATIQEREQLLLELSAKMNLRPSELEESLFKDLEEEQILSRFDTLDPELLIKSYNFALAQTALFKSVSMEFVVSGNWKRIFRDIKRFGLMYRVEKSSDGYVVYLDGPLSLFKMTERYGTSLAKLLPTIVLAGDTWSFKAELIDRHRNNRILRFEENKKSAPEFATMFGEAEGKGKGKVEGKEGNNSSPSLFDSAVEEKFASKFNSFNTGWILRREPEPLIAGRHVMIPDFSFEKYGFKIFMEIVGFWIKEYIERKLSKLASLSPDTEIIVALNENLRCSESKISEIKKSAVMVLTYSKEVPIEPIISRLKALEGKVEEKQVEEIRNTKEFPEFSGEIVNLREIAQTRNVSLEVLKRALVGIDMKSYIIIGDYLLSDQKIESIRKTLEKEFNIKEERTLSLGEASRIIESLHVAVSPTEILSFLDYEIEWNGLDYETNKVKKKKKQKETETQLVQ